LAQEISHDDRELSSDFRRSINGQYMKPLALMIMFLVAGCAGNTSSRDLDADSLYRMGDKREELEEKYGKGTVVWVGDVIPDDAFAAAMMREMVSSGKPRPKFYEIFLRKSMDGGKTYRDYVFFNDLNRVVYTARKQPLGHEQK
jgi:hypothetical protein